MKHSARADSLKEVYSRIGELTYLHSPMQDSLEEFCCNLVPWYLKHWIRENASKSFNEQLMFADDLLTDELRARAKLVFKEISERNKLRNKFLHARMVLEPDPSAQVRGDEYLASFEDKGIRSTNTLTKSTLQLTG